VNTISFPAGINKVSDLHNNFITYPNPTNGLFAIRFKTKNPEGVFLEVYNTIGARLTSQRLNGRDEGNPEQIDLSFLPDGIYFLKISTEEYEVQKKVVIQH
jgi:hypothetical protein